MIWEDLISISFSVRGSVVSSKGYKYVKLDITLDGNYMEVDIVDSDFWINSFFVFMGSSEVIDVMQCVKVHMILLCGCNIYIMKCCNYFLISPTLPLTPTYIVSPTDWSIQILSTTLFHAYLINLFIWSIFFPIIFRVSLSKFFARSPHCLLRLDDELVEWSDII